MRAVLAVLGRGDHRSAYHPTRSLIGNLANGRSRPKPVPQAARRSYRNRTLISDQHLRLRENVGHSACYSRRLEAGVAADVPIAGMSYAVYAACPIGASRALS